MKKQSFTITSLLVISVLFLSACSAPAAFVGEMKKDAADLLKDPATAVAQLAQSSGTSINPVAQVATPAPASQAPIQPGLLASYEGTLQSIYDTVNPQVVNIRVLVPTTSMMEGLPQIPGFPLPNIPGMPNIPGLPGDQNQPNNPDQGQMPYGQGMGSGFVWDKQGHIVTNNHVVDSADKIEVTFSDGTTVPATVVGNDPYSDLAVIKVDLPAEQLSPVQMADSGQVKVGQLAIAIGNPYGLEGTMTAGIVSAIGRTLPASEGLVTSGPTYSIPDIIQTDAPINPGNSGGVLVNATGQVIGVTAAIESSTGQNSGIGFVIPSSIVLRVVPSLIQNGKYEHPYLGISGGSLTPDLAKAMDLQSNQRGALVEDIVPGGPADKAGLQGSDRQVQIDGQDVRVGGDVIVAINGQPIKSMDDIISYLSSNTSVGDKVALTVLRNGKETELQITLGARPSQANETTGQSAQQPQQGQGAWLGIIGQTLTPEIAGAMQLGNDQQGVLVQQVQAGSPADEAGLRGSFKPATINGEQVLVGGDVVTALDGKPVTTIEELKSFLVELQPGQQITLTILRDGNPLELQVTLGKQP